VGCGLWVVGKASKLVICKSPLPSLTLNGTEIFGQAPNAAKEKGKTSRSAFFLQCYK